MLLSGPSPVIVTPPNAAVRVHIIVDLDGVGALGAFTLGFKSGTATQTLSATQITNLLATGANGAVIYTGTNRVTLAD